jgi:predicted permease
MNSMWQDVRYGLRMLTKSPGFTATAVVTLALGIGANTAIFSLINAVMLKTLPVSHPEQLVVFKWDTHKWPPHFSQTGGDSRLSFSYPAFQQFRAQNQALSGVFAFVPLGFNRQNVTVSLNGEPTLANGEMVTGEYFSGLGVSALLERTLTEDDEKPGSARVAVISYAYWSSHFARDAAIVGRTISLNDIPTTIVGVTPASFFGEQPGTEPDVWVPFADLPNLRPWSAKPAYTDSVFTDRDWICLNVMGRLKPGVSREQGESSFDTAFRNFVTADWHPEKQDDVPHLQLAAAGQGLNNLRESYSQPLYLLMAIVGLVLLVACANVATLLLARATARQKEISVRLSVGASRWRLVRQLLTESVLLSGIGGALGLFASVWGTQALVKLISSTDNQVVLEAKPDQRVLLFTFVASVFTGVLFGLAPALRAARKELASAMKERGGDISEGRSGHLLGKSLVVAQISVSLVLMIGAGLFVRTLQNFERKNLGFNQKNLLTFGLDPTRAGYSGGRMVNFYRQLLQKVQALPGIQSATLIQNIPLSGWSNNTNITVEGSKLNVPNNHLRWFVAGPDFFQTMDIPVIAGRGIQESDTVNSARIAVVDETFVKKYLKDTFPIGQRFYLGAGSRPDPHFEFEIVGLVKSAELTDIHSEPVAKAYMSYAQFPDEMSALYFEVRTPANPTSLLPEIREAVRQMDGNLPLMNVSTQTQLTAEALVQERMFARLSSFFGVLALLLASIGLYGTLAYSVTRETHGIGIRLALGATPIDVLRMVLGRGLRLIVAGVAIGLLVAIAATRLMTTVIYGVKPTDPLTFSSVAVVLMAVALLACYLPARRATRVDPLVALRYE